MTFTLPPNRLRHVLVVLLALWSALGVRALARPVSHEDVWLMRRLGAPVISPDGKFAVLRVVEPAYDPRDERDDLWLVSLSGETDPRRLTANRAGEAEVEWSPDGRKIAFSSQRDDDVAPQIYLLDFAAGGDAERVTQMPAGARSPHWSPDGKLLLFTSDALANGAADTFPKPASPAWSRLQVYEHVSPENEYGRPAQPRAHLFLLNTSGPNAAQDLFAESKIVHQPDFSGVWAVGEEQFPARWTPDGKGIVFVATLRATAGTFSASVTQLFLEPVSGGEPQRLTNDANAYGLPIFSPDGRKIFVDVVPSERGFEYTQKRLIRFPWPIEESQRTDLTGKFDGAPDRMALAGDGSKIFFTSQQAGLEKVFSVSTDAGSVHLEFDPPAGVVAELAAGGADNQFRLVGIWNSGASPSELFSFDPQSGKLSPRRLTHFNVERVAGLDLFPVEHFWFQSPRGDRLHSLIVRPAGFDPAKKYPVIALVHGGPHEMASDVFGVVSNYHLLAGTDYVVVATNYVGSTGFGEAFARGVQGSEAQGPAADVAESITEIARRYSFVDAGRCAAVGIGFGGRIVAGQELSNTTAFRCLVVQQGWPRERKVLFAASRTEDAVLPGGISWDSGENFDWREMRAKLSAGAGDSAKWKTPLLLGVGRRTSGAPIESSFEIWNELQGHDTPGRMLVFPEAGPATLRGDDSRMWYAELSAWFKRYLAE